MQNHFETFWENNRFMWTSSIKRVTRYFVIIISRYTKPVLQCISPLPAKTIERWDSRMQISRLEAFNPCVNSSDSMSVRKKSTTPYRAEYVWNSIDMVVVRDTKGCFNEFIRSEGKVPSGAGRKSDWGWVPVDRSEDQRRTWNSIDTLFQMSARGILQSRPIKDD